jgi:hypothetical protein
MGWAPRPSSFTQIGLARHDRTMVDGILLGNFQCGSETTKGHLKSTRAQNKNTTKNKQTKHTEQDKQKLSQKNQPKTR